MGFLLDTGVVSELRHPDCDPGLLAWLADVRPEDVHLSCLALVELRAAAARLRVAGGSDGADRLDAWLDGLAGAYAERVLPVTLGVADRWGRLNGEWSLPATVGLLAATALEHHLTVVTRDPAALAGLGVTTLDPAPARG